MKSQIIAFRFSFLMSNFYYKFSFQHGFCLHSCNYCIWNFFYHVTSLGIYFLKHMLFRNVLFVFQIFKNIFFFVFLMFAHYWYKRPKIHNLKGKFILAQDFRDFTLSFLDSVVKKKMYEGWEY